MKNLYHTWHRCKIRFGMTVGSLGARLLLDTAARKAARSASSYEIKTTLNVASTSAAEIYLRKRFLLVPISLSLSYCTLYIYCVPLLCNHVTQSAGGPRLIRQDYAQDPLRLDMLLSPPLQVHLRHAALSALRGRHVMS